MTDPMTPPECDLRGMPFMPVDLVRLFDSDVYALSSGDEFKAAFTLWGKAFLQVPAGSLPTDDRILAHLSGAGARWAKVKVMALRGWVECSDGRLYHPVVAEKARSAWDSRIAQRARTEAARAARAQKRQNYDSSSTPPTTETVTRHVTTSVTDNVTGSKGEGEGELKGIKKERDAGEARLIDPKGFAEFWSSYPAKVGKAAARKAFPRAVKAAGGDPDEIVFGLKARLHLFAEDPKFIPNPATWLNQGRWEDDPEALLARSQGRH